MTDEKMAEEYREKHICNTCVDVQDCGNDCSFSRCGVQAFLAGLKAGRPKWRKELKELLKEAVQLLKNSDELYGYQIRDFQLKCEQFTKESE
jgi:hypothetical protein